jgi:tRNA(Ile)-lysidine synthase
LAVEFSISSFQFQFPVPLLSDLLDRVSRYAARHALWAQGVRVVAAVSGGSDSVALAFLLRDLAAKGELIFAGIAHLNHHVRGEDAEGDAAFCRVLADRLNVPAIVSDANVPADAKQHGVSIELAGRHARQAFFREAMAAVKADRVAVAHTRDDQAETVLLRLARGAGAGGLGAMAPSREHLIRPLLDTPREELRTYLRDINETWREDATNADRSIPRNRVRHEVMPELRAINAQAGAALARAAELLRSDDEFLVRLANAAFLRCVEIIDEQGTARVTVAEFAKLPVPIARRVARYALETVNPSRTYGLEEVDEFCRAVTAGSDAHLTELSVERFAADAVLVKRRVHGVHKVPTVQTPSVDSIELRLDVPGTVEAPRGAWTITARGPIPSTGDPRTGSPAPPLEVSVDANAIGSRLIVRYRRPGDRLHPLGAPGRRKVQDVLVDRKVPRDDRDMVPIVTTEKGEIVWVAGEVLADPFRVTPLTTSVVVLTLRR